MPVRDYKDGLWADLQDPEFAVAYLNAALEENAPEVFLLHLRDVVEAWGGLGKLAADTQLAREALYRMLSTQGNPQLASLDKILHALGLRLAVARVSAPSAAVPRAGMIFRTPQEGVFCPTRRQGIFQKSCEKSPLMANDLRHAQRRAWSRASHAPSVEDNDLLSLS
jgi:probable addiction module antidote protein